MRASLCARCNKKSAFFLHFRCIYVKNVVPLQQIVSGQLRMPPQSAFGT